MCMPMRFRTARVRQMGGLVLVAMVMIVALVVIVALVAMSYLDCRNGKRGVTNGHQGSFDARQRRKPSPMSIQMRSARCGSSMEIT